MTKFDPENCNLKTKLKNFYEEHSEICNRFILPTVRIWNMRDYLMSQSKNEKLPNILRKYYAAYYNFIVDGSDAYKHELDICSTDYIIYSLMRTNYPDEVPKYYSDT